MVARFSTIDTYTRMFHFKCTHNILYLNRQLHDMGHAETKLCSYCNMHDETMSHLFYECPKTTELWAQIKMRLPGIELPDITPESVYIGLPSDTHPLIQHIHLLFKICLYKGRGNNNCNIQFVINKIKQVRQIEARITHANPRRSIYNRQKWSGVPENP